MKKAVATHYSTLAWKIPWMEEPGRLQSMGSRRVRHYWATSLPLFTVMHWRRKWQPIPVLLPGESQVQGNLVWRHLVGRTESDTTEVTAVTRASLNEENQSNKLYPMWVHLFLIFLFIYCCIANVQYYINNRCITIVYGPLQF